MGRILIENLVAKFCAPKKKDNIRLPKSSWGGNSLKTSTLIIILIIAGLIGIIGAAYLLQGEETKPIVTNVTQKTPYNVTPARGAAELVAVQEGPKTAQPGTNVTITCKIKNIGSEPAENITVTSQVFEKHIDKINPNEEVEFTVEVYIPTP